MLSVTFQILDEPIITYYCKQMNKKYLFLCGTLLPAIIMMLFSTPGMIMENAFALDSKNIVFLNISSLNSELSDADSSSTRISNSYSTDDRAIATTNPNINLQKQKNDQKVNLGGSGSGANMSVTTLGDNDLAVANSNSDNVSILLGDGHGKFGGGIEVPVGDFPTAVAVGLFNDADSFQDLAVANAAGRTVSILLGNGDGTFGQANDFPVGDRPASIAVGSFD
jgi:hypothetical protein